MRRVCRAALLPTATSLSSSPFFALRMSSSSSVAASAAAGHGPVGTAIAGKLSESFTPSALQVLNESHMHNVPPGSETHFKVVVVSDAFEGVKLLDRHRLVNALLKDELAGPVHALSINAKTPAQWEKKYAVAARPANPPNTQHKKIPFTALPCRLPLRAAAVTGPRRQRPTRRRPHNKSCEEENKALRARAGSLPPPSTTGRRRRTLIGGFSRGMLCAIFSCLLDPFWPRLTRY